MHTAHHTIHKKLLLLLFLSAALLCRAQEPMPQSWLNYMELLAEEEDETMVEELMELYETFCDNPINLNDTDACLQGLPFISPLQRDYLRSYIIQYGGLLSVNELYAIHGFDSLTIELLRPIVCTQTRSERKPITLKELLTHGHSNFVTGLSGTIEQARGYLDTIYEGDNMRFMWRYSYKYKDRIQLQLAGDKDPGEAFFSGSQTRGFDFYGYSLMVNDIGAGCKRLDDSHLRWHEKPVFIRRLVLGQYHLQFGQGLTLWSGYGVRTSWGTSISRYAQGIRPNGAFTEYGYLEGAATTAALGRYFDLTLFYSSQQRDATLPRQAARDSSIDWVQSLYNSGYHRTATEIGKIDQLGEKLMGAHLELHNSCLHVGLTGVATLLDRPIIPATYVYNDNAFSGDHNYNAGIDFTLRCRRWLFFGEAALCANHAFDSTLWNVSPAMLIGSEFILNNNHRVSGQLRRYSPTYHNLHASSVGQNGYPQNELGGGINYQGRLPLGINATASADWFRFPHMKYLVYDVSNGCEYRLMLSYSLPRVKGLSLGLRYRYKERGRNITPSTEVDGHYLLEQVYRHQLQGDITYSSGAWKLVTRIGYAHYRGDVTEPDKGLLLYQDLQYRPSSIPLTMALRVAWFDVDDYEARLYSVESDFIYQYSSVMYQNEGMRGYLLLKYDISQHWNIGFKYSITQYSDRDTFGSGYELIDANHRQQWRIQMRLKW